MDLFLKRRELAVAGEGRFTLVEKGLLPVTQEVRGDAEGAGSLGDGIALLSDELDGLGLELGGVSASRSRHCWTSQGEFTLLPGCPQFVGKSTVTNWNPPASNCCGLGR